MRFAALVALSLLAPVTSLNASAVAGGLFVCTTPCGSADNTALTSFTSSLNAALAAAAAAAPPLTAANRAVLLNARSSPTALSFLTISGAWTADEPLFIPSQTVFLLADNATVTASEGLVATSAALRVLPSVVYANGSYAALVAPSGPAGGARVSCGGLPVRGVLIAGGSGVVLDGVTVAQCGGWSATCTGAVHFVGAPFGSGGTVARCVIVDSCRAVWVQTFSRLLIRDNVISNCSKFCIDFDSYASSSVAVGNTVSGAGQNAVFLEQGCVNIVIVNNVLTDSYIGVAVYNYQFPVVTSNLFVVTNTIARCTYAVAVGSTGGNVNWTGASAVSFFGNTLAASNRAGAYANGPQKSTTFSDNDDPAGFSASVLALAGSAVAFDPLGRAVVYNASKVTSSSSPSSTVTASVTTSASTTLSQSASLGASPTGTPTGSLTQTPTPTLSQTPASTPSMLPTPSPLLPLPLTPSPSASPSPFGVSLPGASPLPADALAAGAAGAAACAPLLAPLPALLWGSVGFVAGVALAGGVAAATRLRRRTQRSAAGSVRHLHAAPSATLARARGAAIEEAGAEKPSVLDGDSGGSVVSSRSPLWHGGGAAVGGSRDSVPLSGGGASSGASGTASSDGVDPLWIKHSDGDDDWFEHAETGELVWEIPSEA